MKYIFILGNNPELSQAEIAAVLPQAKELAHGSDYLVVDCDRLDHFRLMKRLGGIIKIGVVLGEKPDYGPILNAAAGGNKLKFGVSFYGVKKSNFGMRAKAVLKERGISARLVESRENALSSVIVTKEKARDFLILPGYFGLTVAVQDWRNYSRRDYGRPAADALSGMLPPKLAKIMINLSGAQPNNLILDPFCGSGTILSEALALGYSNLIGTDFSDKAIKDTKDNLNWLVKELRIINYKLRIEKLNAINLSENIPNNSIDAIITEPFLGKPMRGNEKPKTINAIINELKNLYLQSFLQFKKVLKKSGRVVIVIPEWHIGDQVYRLSIEKDILAGGWQRQDKGNLLYRRENQKVWRNIQIWKKSQ